MSHRLCGVLVLAIAPGCSSARDGSQTPAPAPTAGTGCGAATPVCGAYDTVKPEDTWCFDGKEVRQLLRGKGGLQFNNVSAPADGMYDVTWWYHCGNNDNFHDPTCRGEPHTPAGCRPG